VSVQPNNYRSFIRTIMNDGVRGRKISLQELADRAQLSSKGFVSDLLGGKKRISAKTLPRIVSALRLTGARRRLFECLVYLEEQDLRPPTLRADELPNKIQFYRRQLAGKRQVIPDHNKIERAGRTNSYHSYLVYAALGSGGEAFSALQLSAKAELTVPETKAALNILIDSELVDAEDSKYRARTGDVDFTGLEHYAAFTQVFASALKELHARGREMSKFPKVLFLFTAFSLSQEREKEFRERLRALVLDFVDAEQVDDGEKVKKLIVGLF
jgi:uncharacterized protein (TIGR02147 family)